MTSTAETATLNPVLRSFWETPARNRVLLGGRASSKSWDAAGFAIFLAQAYSIRVLCTRQFQNKISESVYTLLKIQIERFGLQDEFDIQKNVIRHKVTGSEFLFYGLWRHIDEIKSLEGIDICWIEEAHSLTPSQWEILEPTIRKDGSQFWIVFNPKLVTDFVYRRFVRNPPPRTIVRHINYDENPFLSQTMHELIAAAKEEDFEEFQHVYLGVPRDDDDRVVIKRSWIMAAIDADRKIKPLGGEWRGGKTVGYDVADGSVEIGANDANATVAMDGSVCVDVDQWHAGEDELFESAMRARNTAIRLDAQALGYDSIGVGAGTGSHLKRMKYFKYFKFNAGGKVAHPKRKYGDTEIRNEDFFKNLKAQAWWQTADRFRNTYIAITKGRQFDADEMISISSEIDGKLLEILIDELSTPRRDTDLTGAKVKVESKKDLQKREIPSPNIADAFIIANSRGLTGSISYKEML